LLRRLLACACLLSYLLGMLMIFSLPIGQIISALGAALWTLLAVTEWLLISSAHKRTQRIRIHCDGAAELLDQHGEWQAATICRECIVLSTLAWLKLKPQRGGRYFELVRGDRRKNEQWRRLQVIWRHLGTAGRSC
jgi:hypothetical protein